MQKVLHIVGGILGAIVLGAIGSGLWERVLSPSLSWLSNLVTGVSASLSATYRDSIYERAAVGTSDLYVVKITCVLFIFVGSAVVLPFLYQRLTPSSLSPRLQWLTPRIWQANKLGMALALIVTGMFLLASVDGASKIRSPALRSLEILRPKIGDQRYYELRAQFFAVETKADYLNFEGATRKLASEQSVKIPLAEISPGGA